jgi:hypothetical protein
VTTRLLRGETGVSDASLTIAELSDCGSMLELDFPSQTKAAATWLHQAYLNAYRKGCSYQFTVPANDRDIEILNQEIVAAMVEHAKEQIR